MDEVISRTEAVAASEALLTSNGYQRVPLQDLSSSWGNGRAYEDEYGVVGLFTFNTMTDLCDSWSAAQDALVDLITHYMSRDEAKAWDGYLVLMTPGMPDEAAAAMITTIRRDTNRVRKLVATGTDLRTLSDVRRSLEGLLPLEPEASLEASASAMDLLPAILEERGVERRVAERLVRAFEQQESMMLALGEGAGE